VTPRPADPSTTDPANNPSLWHWHGDQQHAHPGGDQPHGPHVYAPARRHSALHNWWGAFLIIAVVAGAIWAFTASSANECSNALVGALDSNCGLVTTAHDGALGVGIVAVLLFVVALAS
jgi:hypothetical protein